MKNAKKPNEKDKKQAAKPGDKNKKGVKQEVSRRSEKKLYT